MSERSIFAIGDIHGQYWKLVSLLSKMPIAADDLVVFVGDYIDRGPESCQVIELLLQMRDGGQPCVFLRGNHEQMMLDSRDAFMKRPIDWDRHLLWMGNGGAETIDSYPAGVPWWTRFPDSHWSFFEATAFEYWIGPFAFVHAGFVPPGAVWEHTEDPRLWVREEFLKSDHDFGARVVFGHTPQRSHRPLAMANKLGIDTAAGYDGPLSGVRLRESARDEFELFQS